MTVICDNCQAVNRDKAMFCRGCAGKLPAFVATAPAPLAMPAGVAGPGAGGGTRSRGSRRARHDRRIRRWWFAAILLLGAVAAALVGWIALAPGRTTAAVTAPALAASAASAPSGTVPFESALAPGESAIAPGSAAPSSPLPTVVTTPDSTSPTGAAPTIAPRPATAARAQAARTSGNGRADPRAGCEHLFFAFAARCEANHCAEAAYARHPRCEVVRAERQRDDARRNMTSGY